jgi:hypothetical protein
MGAYVEKVNRYLKDRDYRNIDIFHDDAEKVILYDKNTSIKILIKKATIGIKDISTISLGRLDEFIREYSRLNGFVNDNHVLKLIKDIALSYNGYWEFILVCRDHRLDLESLINFKIKGISIDIGEPSDSFKLVYKFLEEIDTFDWRNHRTIKFYNLKKDDINDYLQETIFLLEHYKPWYLQLGYRNTYLDTDIKELRKTTKPALLKNFPKAHFSNPICFYNEAVRRTYTNPEDEIAFLYYYKVIEYFFFINRKQEIIDIIQGSLHDINKLLLRIDEVYKTDEKSCLMYIVKNKKIENQVDQLVLEAYSEKLISNKTQEVFINSIYSFRNSIVHGKGGTRFEIKTTNILKPDTKVISWNSIIKSFAYICILEFCYDSKI